MREFLIGISNKEEIVNGKSVTRRFGGKFSIRFNPLF